MVVVLTLSGCGSTERESEQDAQISRLERRLKNTNRELAQVRRVLREQGLELSAQASAIRKKMRESARRIEQLNAETKTRSSYAASMQAYRESIDAYWTTKMASSYGRTDYRNPDIQGAYDADEPQRCGGESFTLPGNAFYCRVSDYIAWDEDGLMYRLYNDVGSFAPGVVLAHEWGHAIQNYLGDPTSGIARELDADCFAGAWAGSMARAGEVNREDFVTALKTLLEIADDPSLEWLDPDAHGTAAERNAAFNQGVEGDAEACIPPASRAEP